jgi:tRNA pseudouridine38-40 synthase
VPRYVLLIEYDGTDFCGWQTQKDQITIQEEIEKAIFALTKEKVVLFGAGRTDSGVHARGQVAHFDLTKEISIIDLVRGINFFLRPNKIVIISACIALDQDFHARFSATKRHYQYLIINRNAPLILSHNRAWNVRQKLDEKLMQEAANYLIGKHDFTSFRAKFCQAQSPIITMDKINIIRNDAQISINLKARSFLHHMVRNIVGTLFLAGIGKIQPEYLQVILQAQDRNIAGMTAPSTGLYFTHIEYDNNLDIMAMLGQK